MVAQKLTESSLRDWMAKLGPRLIALSHGICRDRHRAEEIVQEAFVKLWRSPPDAGEIAYRSWLRRVVTNLSINALQRTRKTTAIPEFSDDTALRSGSRPEQSLEQEEQMRLLASAMDKLDPAKRAILTLRASELLSYEDIAEHLGVPVGTVMSRLNRARAALAEQMKQQTADDEENSQSYDIRKFRQA